MNNPFARSRSEARPARARIDVRAWRHIFCGVFLILLALDLYSLVVFVAVILSWVRLSPDHPLVRFTEKLTEPVLGRIRSVLPAFGGMDFSAMVLLFALRMARRLLVG